MLSKSTVYLIMAALVLAVAVLWITRLNVAPAVPGFLNVAAVLAGAAAVGHVGGFKLLRRFAALSCSFCLATLCVLSLTYGGTAIGMPLQDALFMRMDAVLGFDWRIAGPWMDSHPQLTAILGRAYDKFGILMWMPVCILPLIGASEEAERFVQTYLVAGLITALVASLLPAVSAATALAGDGHVGTTLRFSAATGAIVNGLRSGTLSVIEDWAGIVTFPSFHTAGSVLVAFAFRKTPYLRFPAALCAAVEILSALWIGGHYLVDLPAGLAVAAGAILLAHKMGAPSSGTQPAPALQPLMNPPSLLTASRQVSSVPAKESRM